MHDTKIRVPVPSDDMILVRTSIHVIQGRITILGGGEGRHQTNRLPTVSEHDNLEDISTAELLEARINVSKGGRWKAMEGLMTISIDSIFDSL